MAAVHPVPAYAGRRRRALDRLGAGLSLPSTLRRLLEDGWQDVVYWIVWVVFAAIAAALLLLSLNNS